MKSPNSTTQLYPCYSLIEFVENLRKSRKDKIDFGTNLTIMLLSTTIIEGVIFDLLRLELKLQYNKNTIEGRLFNDLIEKIDKATWQDFNYLFKVVFNLNINECVENELWKIIQHLFGFRNDIVHGKPIIVNKYFEGGSTYYEYLGKMKKIQSLLVEKKILEKNKPGFLNNDTSDFFWDNTKKFILQLYGKIKNNNNLIVGDLIKEFIIIQK